MNLVKAGTGSGTRATTATGKLVGRSPDLSTYKLEIGASLIEVLRQSGEVMPMNSSIPSEH